MGTITFTEKEYKELVKTRKKIETLLRFAKVAKKPAFDDETFGILEKSFGGPSAKYVSRLRKSWRN